MAVRFLLGPAGSGKTFHCLESLRRLEREGCPGVYLVPEQFTYSADRELLEAEDLAGLRHVRVLSFSRLAWWLHDRAGTVGPEPIDDAVRPMYLRAVLERMPVETLGPIAGMKSRQGVLQQLSRFVGEVRNHGPQSFVQSVLTAESHVDRPAALEKLRSLTEVYEAYAARLREIGRSDPEERLFGLEPLIAADAEYVAKLEFFVDGFLSWTRRESELLVALASAGASIQIALCCDPGAVGPGEEVRFPFLPVRRSHAQLVAAFERAKIEILPALLLPGDHPTRFSTAALARLEDQLYRLGSEEEEPDSKSDASDSWTLTTEEETPSIAMCEAWDRRQEVLLWARQVDRWTRLDPEPVDRGEIAILMRDVEPYRELVQEVFSRYDIPFFLDERRNVLATPRVRLLLGALEVLLSDWRRDAVVAFLRNPLLSVAPSVVDLLENLSLEFGRDFEHWHLPEWEEYPHPGRFRYYAPNPELEGTTDPALKHEGEVDPESAEEESEDPIDFEPAREPEYRVRITDPVRRRVLLPLFELGRTWAQDQWTGNDAADAVRKLLGELAELSELEDAPPGEFEWEERVAEALDQMLADLAEIWSDVPVTIEEFARTLREGLLALKLGITPIRHDQVLVGDVQRSRVHGIRRAIIGGVNEGVFPRTVADDPILNEKDREALAEIGVSLGPTAVERQEEEAYLFYIALTRSSETTLVTFSRMSAMGEPMVASLLVDEILRSDASIRRFVAPPHPQEMSVARLQRAEELGGRLLSGAAGWRDGEEVPASESIQLAEAYNRIATWLARKEGPGVNDSASVAPIVPDPAEVSDPTLGFPDQLSLFGGAPAPSIRTEPASDNLSVESSQPALESAVRIVEDGRPALLHQSAPHLPDALTTILMPGDDLLSSVSRLQEFASCPFRSFAKNGLRLRPRPEATITPLETGTLAHSVLEEFFAEATHPLDIEERLEKIFRALASDPQFRAFDVDEASRYRWRSTEQSLRRYLDLELRRLGATPYGIRSRELSFGPDTRNSLRLPLVDGHTLVLRGQIDRVDLREPTEPGGRPLGLVIDYKRSAKAGLPRKLEEGLDLQLAAYLLHLRDVQGFEPAGGLYVPVLPTPRRPDVKGGGPNELGVQAHGIFLRSESEEIDGGSKLLPLGSHFQRVDRERMSSLLETGRDYLASYATTYRKGWVAARPLVSDSQLPCERCDFPAVCRFRRNQDPRRHDAMDGMSEVHVEDTPTGPVARLPEST